MKRLLKGIWNLVVILAILILCEYILIGVMHNETSECDSSNTNVITGKCTSFYTVKHEGGKGGPVYWHHMVFENGYTIYRVSYNELDSFAETYDGQEITVRYTLMSPMGKKADYSGGKYQAIEMYDGKTCYVSLEKSMENSKESKAVWIVLMVLAALVALVFMIPYSFWDISRGLEEIGVLGKKKKKQQK